MLGTPSPHFPGVPRPSSHSPPASRVAWPNTHLVVVGSGRQISAGWREVWLFARPPHSGFFLHTQYHVAPFFRWRWYKYPSLPSSFPPLLDSIRAITRGPEAALISLTSLHENIKMRLKLQLRHNYRPGSRGTDENAHYTQQNEAQ
jgi:hypothetical protein